MSPFQIWVRDDFREDFCEDSKVYLIEPLLPERRRRGAWVASSPTTSPSAATESAWRATRRASTCCPTRRCGRAPATSSGTSSSAAASSCSSSPSQSCSSAASPSGQFALSLIAWILNGSAPYVYESIRIWRDLMPYN